MLDILVSKLLTWTVIFHWKRKWNLLLYGPLDCFFSLTLTLHEWKYHCVIIAVVIMQVQYLYKASTLYKAIFSEITVKLLLEDLVSKTHTPKRQGFWFPSHLQLHILVYVCAKFHAFCSNCTILSPFHWTRNHFLIKTQDYSLLPGALLNSVTDGFMRVFWNNCTKTKLKNIQKNFYCGVHFKYKCSNTIYSLLPN